MPVKDYYKILDVSNTASPEDIKRSYRRLAMKYHPDKNLDKKIAQAKFQELQEAYHILSNYKKRQQYNHTRYDEKHGLNKKPTTNAATPQSILQKCTNLRKNVVLMDPHRIDRDNLYNKVQGLLSPHNMQVLNHHDHNTNRWVVDEIIHISQMLQFKQIKQVCIQLATIAGTDNELHQKIYSFQKQQLFKEYWNRYHLVAAIIVVALFCYFIYTIST